MKSILFVCLGNICRSPLAHGIALDIANKNNLDIKIDSAGTSSWHNGEPPCENSIKVAKNHNIDISKQISRLVKKKDFKKFDLIVALDQNNYDDLLAMGCKNLVKLGDYGFGGDDVPDPYYYKNFDGFEKVFEMIEISVRKLLNSIK